MFADSEGEFLQSKPVCHDAPSRRKRAVEDVEVILKQWHYLEEANEVIEAAVAKGEEQAQKIANFK